MYKQIDYYTDADFSFDRLVVRQKKALEEIKACLVSLDKPVVRIMDIGCATGAFLYAIRKMIADLRREPAVRYELYGIDYSQVQIEKAASRVPGVNWLEADANQELPYPDGFFDLVYSTEVIEHLYSPDHFMAEIYRIVQKTAKIIAATPNLCCWISRVNVLLGVYPMFYESSTKNANYGYGFLKRIKA